MEYAYKLTTHGLAVMAACMTTGDPFRITRVAFGSGIVGEGVNLTDVHELLSYVSDGAIAERRHEDNRLYLTIQFANQQHPEVKTFLLSEFIVYVEDPANGVETDMLYGTLGDYRQPVPAYSPALPPSVFNFPLIVVLSDDINAAVSAPAGLVTHGELAALIDGMAVRRADVTIPATGWTGGGGGLYPYHRDVPVEGAAERLIPSMTVLPEGMDAAVSCGFAPFVQALDGVVRVFAACIPAVSIPASITLQGDASAYCRVGTGDGGAYSLPPATVSSLGAVKPGKTLKVAEDGTLDVNTASETEVEEMLAGI